ncbi:hypothetical protein [Streptomyces sp. NPDC005438]|uniref:hypothetical protein n=1 Tax=Streptomyces sp. NPDC005438 TaxID=3156880 RepID=UPI0033B7A6ED
MSDSELGSAVRPHLRDEKVRLAVSCYLGAGLSRAVLAVTDRRVLMVRSAYWSIRDKGLLWADPLEEVALSELPRELRAKGAYTGNTYLRLRRADGSTVKVNPRAGFAGDHDQTRRNVAQLYRLVEGRF